jgi:hypothetical protein
MKKFANYPFLIIFLISMSLGFRAGSNFILPVKSEIAAPTSKALRKLSALPSGQRSILLVVVDAFGSEEPVLESAWLILYLPDNPRITLMPVFPTLSRDIASDERIKERFSVDKNSDTPVLSEGFLSYLTNMDFWWSGYVLMDLEALNQISISLVAPGSKGHWKQTRSDLNKDESYPLKELPFTWEAGRASAASQAHFYQELCKRASDYAPSSPEPGGLKLEDLIPNHLYVDFFMEQLNKEILALRSHGSNLSCEFPLFYSEPVTTQ